MTETALQFGAGGSLVGIVCEPPFGRREAGLPAVVLLNSGLIHHVGPNRLWVRVARSLAARGFATLRFDLSGIGDSMASADRRPAAERWVAEAGSAMDVLAATRGIERFVLVGNCSGATLAYRTALADRRVVGAALLNPPGRHIARYFLRLMLTNRKSWLRILDSRLRLPRRGRWTSRGPTRADDQRTVDPAGLLELARRDVDLLVASSEWDPGYDFFHRRERRRLSAPDAAERIALEVIPRSNHEFTLLDNQERLLRTLDGWTERMREERWRPSSQPSLR
jgi:pimeloyl-ACP methyl ester carboxylesterase